jgi:PAS domain S-box-containing protein
MAKKHLPYVFVKRQTLEALKNKQLLAEKEISLATTFIKEIEKGNLQSDYYGEEAAEEKSELASSLISMASKMQEISKEEKERNWATEGLAKFMDILRSQNDDTNELVDDIFRNLIRYMEMNQGALYLVNDEDPDDVFIELITCYAYNRKKHIQRKIALGEGLIGQVILEKETTYMTEIPEKYIKITSGLGEALPRNLLLVPLKIEDKVLGAIELASFKKIPDYRIQFVEKLGESIASTISAVKINQRTKYLLQESQQQAEELKAQEEEMRQNLEEMSAIQEEMERATQELQHREQYLNDLINLSKDTIFTYDKDFKVTSFNKAYADSIKGSGFEATVGMDVFQFLSEEEKEYYKQLYTRALQGESFTLNHSFGAGEGVEVHMSIQYAPLRNTEGEVMAGAVFANDVTEQIRLEMDMRAREEAVSLSTILSESDLHGTITYVNQKLCEVSGYTKEELIGQPHSIFRHPDMPKALFKEFWKTIKSGEIFRGIIKNRTKTDGHYWVDASIIPVKDKNGKTIKYIGSRYHITDDDIATELYNRQAEKLGVPKL